MKRSFRVFKSDGQEITPTHIYEDERTPVDTMFYNWDNKTGKKTFLSIVALDCSDCKPSQQNIKLRDCIPVLKNYLANCNEVPTTDQGEDLIVLGGARLGPYSMGRLMIPAEQVGQFCQLTKQIATLIKEV